MRQKGTGIGPPTLVAGWREGIIARQQGLGGDDQGPHLRLPGLDLGGDIGMAKETPVLAVARIDKGGVDMGHLDARQGQARLGCDPGLHRRVDKMVFLHPSR